MIPKKGYIYVKNWSNSCKTRFNCWFSFRDWALPFGVKLDYGSATFYCRLKLLYLNFSFYHWHYKGEK